jgi:hypothetical protein
MPKWMNYMAMWQTQEFVVPTDAATAFRDSTLPGVKIMKRLAKLSHPHDDIAVKVQLLFRCFVEYSREEANWTWVGAGSCGTATVLDNNTQSVECQAFAVGLRALMIFPAPFGLGINKDECAVKVLVKKLGVWDCGFISRHPIDGVLGLRPNIRTPDHIDGTLFPGGYYLWDNHKVVLYKGIYYDPAYGRQYADMAQMIALTVEDYGKEDAPKPDTGDRWDAAIRTDQTGQYFLRCRARGHDYKLRALKVVEHGEGYRYSGPFPVIKGEEEKKELPVMSSSITSSSPPS